MNFTPVRTVLLVMVALLVLPAGATAQEERTLSIEPDTLEAGDTFDVSGDCPEAAGGEELEVLASEGFPGGLLGRVQADADGSFSGQATIHENSPAVTGTVSVPCNVDNVVVSGELTVTETDDATDDGTEEGEIRDEDVPTGGVDAGTGGAGEGLSLATLFAVVLGLLVLGLGATLALRRSRA